MSMPNIPDIKPKIIVNRGEVIDLLLASIALEELSLAHILNAEAEKLQCVIGDHCKPCKLEDLICINEAVEKTLKDVIKKEILLEFKFENILELIKCKDKKKPCRDDEE